MISLLVLLVSGAAWAQSATNHALVVGGGCEYVSGSNKGTGSFCDTDGKAAGHWNLFRPEFETTVTALNANGWNTTVLYDSESWQRPWPNSSPFTKDALFGALKERVKNAKPGEEFLLSINTHGSTDPHAICLGDGTLLKVSELTPYLKKLTDNHVKVAVVDSSCYSGNTVRQLSATGACVLTGGPANVTGAGDTIVPYIFGLGLPKGARIPSYYLQTIPDAPADLDGDGRISAAEAFAFARLNDSYLGIGQTSDCELDAQRIRELLEGTAPVLRVGRGVLHENLNGEEERPTKAEPCKLAALGDAFAKLASNSLPQAVLLRSSCDLAALGPSGGPTLLERAAQLKANTSKLGALIQTHEANQDRVDALLGRNKPVPGELKAQLEKAEGETLELRRAIFDDLRPLLQLACENEKTANPRRARPCESFDLFPKRSGT